MTGQISALAEVFLRNFVIDGVPASGINNPAKADGLATFAAIDQSITGGVLLFDTWAHLQPVVPTTGAHAGAYVLNDAGTHTDPVVGGTVPNAGAYSYSTAPAGWQRVGPIDSALAKQWATQLGGTVDGVEYSAKEYAIGADIRIAGKGSAKDWATLTGGGKADGADYSAKEYAIGTDIRIAGYGSAKDWANYLGGTVDGTGYSAAYWANQAAVTAASALQVSGKDQIIGRPVTPGAGTTFAGPGTYLFYDPINLIGTLQQINLYANAAGTLLIAIYNRTSQALFTRVGAAVSVPVVAGLQTLTPAQFGAISVTNGQYIGISAPITYTSAPVDGRGWIAAGTPPPATINWSAPNVQFRLEIGFLFSGSQVVDLVTKRRAGPFSLALDNVETIVGGANSYYEGISLLKGKSISQLVSALTEYNFFNQSKAGYTTLDWTNTIQNKLALLGGAALSTASPGYMLLADIGNSVGHFSDALIATYFEGAIDLARRMGWKPVLINEVGGAAGLATTDGEQSRLRLLRGVAERNRLPLIDVASKSRVMSPSIYAPFWMANHAGVRTVYLFVDQLVRGIRQLLPRPMWSMKIFRVRGTVTVASPADLSFRTVAQRHRLFKELYLGQSAIADASAGNYDNLGSSQPLQNVLDEYYGLKTGAATALGTWALIDCVVPVLAPRGVVLTLSDTTITVYCRQLKNDGTIAWTQLPQLSDGRYIVPDDILGYVDGDRIAFLLNKGAGITLTASPIVSGADGIPRLPEPPLGKLWPPQGAEMMAQPLTVVSGAIPAAWTNSGALPVVSGDDATYPFGVTGVVEVTNAAGLSQRITYPPGIETFEVSIRVWARRWVPIYAGGSSFPAGAAVTYETCDTGTLQVTASGPSAITSAASTMVDQVGMAWTEVEFRQWFECNPAATMTVAIDVRSQDVPIQIGKVSVKPVPPSIPTVFDQIATLPGPPIEGGEPDNEAPLTPDRPVDEPTRMKTGRAHVRRS